MKGSSSIERCRFKRCIQQPKDAAFIEVATTGEGRHAALEAVEHNHHIPLIDRRHSARSSMLVGVFGRSEMVNVGGSRLHIGVDIVGREPDGEFIRLHGEFLNDEATHRGAHEFLRSIVEPFVEGRLQFAVALRESPDAIVVIPFVPGDADDLFGWLPADHEPPLSPAARSLAADQAFRES